jgi:membrane-bound lytic murein transglycosylase D
VAALQEIFEAEGVPGELVWLAEVESRFDPQARSRSGAVGLFQLMPATARRFGLRTWPRDERRRPAASARAAAAYLRFLYGRFGDWPLAVAAYNAGEERVARAMRLRGGASAGGFAAVAAGLPGETRDYVPRVANVIAEREGVTLDELRPAGGVPDRRVVDRNRAGGGA